MRRLGLLVKCLARILQGPLTEGIADDPVQAPGDAEVVVSSFDRVGPQHQVQDPPLRLHQLLLVELPGRALE